MQAIDTKTYENLKAGDEQARRLVYERYREKVSAFCYHMTLDPQAAADLTQDVFVKVITRISTLENNEAFPSWLFAIARNEVYAFFRRSRTMKQLDDEDIWEEETPLDVLIGTERSALVRALVGALQPSYREALLLREFESLPYAEIAAATQSSEAAVKARLFKARKALLEKLKPFVGED